MFLEEGLKSLVLLFLWRMETEKNQYQVSKKNKFVELHRMQRSSTQAGHWWLKCGKTPQLLLSKVSRSPETPKIVIYTLLSWNFSEAINSTQQCTKLLQNAGNYGSHSENTRVDVAWRGFTETHVGRNTKLVPMLLLCLSCSNVWIRCRL